MQGVCGGCPIHRLRSAQKVSNSVLQLGLTEQESVEREIPKKQSTNKFVNTSIDSAKGKVFNYRNTKENLWTKCGKDALKTQWVSVLPQGRDSASFLGGR